MYLLFVFLGLLGFGDEDYVSEPVPEALLDPQYPSDPPRRHMGVTGDVVPPPLVRPHWMRVLWGPPAMEITRGGELRVQVRARVRARGLVCCCWSVVVDLGLGLGLGWACSIHRNTQSVR